MATTRARHVALLAMRMGLAAVLIWLPPFAQTAWGQPYPGDGQEAIGAVIIFWLLGMAAAILFVFLGSLAHFALRSGSLRKALVVDGALFTLLAGVLTYGAVTATYADAPSHTTALKLQPSHSPQKAPAKAAAPRPFAIPTIEIPPNPSAAQAPAEPSAAPPVPPVEGLSTPGMLQLKQLLRLTDEQVTEFRGTYEASSFGNELMLTELHPFLVKEIAKASSDAQVSTWWENAYYWSPEFLYIGQRLERRDACEIRFLELRNGLFFDPKQHWEITQTVSACCPENFCPDPMSDLLRFLYAVQGHSRSTVNSFLSEQIDYYFASGANPETCTPWTPEQVYQPKRVLSRATPDAELWQIMGSWKPVDLLRFECTTLSSGNRSCRSTLQGGGDCLLWRHKPAGGFALANIVREQSCGL